MQVQNGVHAVHPNEIENRLLMAERFIDYIRVNMPSARAANLASLRQSDWEALADLQGERYPSASTISSIIAILWERERAADAAVAAIQGALQPPRGRLLARFDRPDAKRV